MVTLVIFAIAFAFLFLLAFVTKRRCGVLGLALSAGALLSNYWTEAVKAFLETQGVVFDTPPLATVVALGLSLAPALLLLAGGPSYGSKVSRLFGSLLFGFAAFLFTLPILTSMFIIDATAQPVVDFLTKYKSSLLAALLVYAVIDTLLAQSKHKSGKKKEAAH